MKVVENDGLDRRGRVSWDMELKSDWGGGGGRGWGTDCLFGAYVQGCEWGVENDGKYSLASRTGGMRAREMGCFILSQFRFSE